MQRTGTQTNMISVYNTNTTTNNIDNTQNSTAQMYAQQYNAPPCTPQRGVLIENKNFAIPSFNNVMQSIHSSMSSNYNNSNNNTPCTPVFNNTHSTTTVNRDSSLSAMPRVQYMLPPLVSAGVSPGMHYAGKVFDSNYKTVSSVAPSPSPVLVPVNPSQKQQQQQQQQQQLYPTPVQPTGVSQVVESLPALNAVVPLMMLQHHAESGVSASLPRVSANVASAKVAKPKVKRQYIKKKSLQKKGDLALVPGTGTSIDSISTINTSDISSSSSSSSSSSVNIEERRRHVCEVCATQFNEHRAFTTSGHLARHKRIHSGEKNFVCLLPGCNQRFSRKDNMNQHYKTHLKKTNNNNNKSSPEDQV